ncbi:MAG: hypothetical protein UR99_C0066G0008 [Candidatus Moranbacteria bacterium GW2011_GWD2_36_12]|nr:MAG: hypothetical protein UR99_C0066G0008 [Candidatus Moranbacteria bacterium GW2011_GWD2_36_12]KKQ04542.1 MAG: hypothetical protein US16_C0055G0008 [Candidatus Moranbacteria bacterium GW2011_GWE2_36_40]
MRIIRASSADIKGIARMINEQGARLIEEDLEPINVLSLVNLQLQRLIDGTIHSCMNESCVRTFTFHDFIKNPLIMTCSEDCLAETTRIAGERIISTLRLEIPELEKRVRDMKISMSSLAVRQGDIADKAHAQGDDISEKILRTKKARLNNLIETMFAINKGTFSIACKNDACEEDIPISALINSPEIGYCLACRR